MSGVTALAPQFVRLISTMPIPGTPGAPVFDGKDLSQFILVIEAHANACNVQFADLPPLVPRYCSRGVRLTIQDVTEFSKTATDWDAAKKCLESFYGPIDQVKHYSMQFFVDYLTKTSNKPTFTKSSQVDKYFRDFTRIATSLVKVGQLSDNEKKLRFFAGLPSELRTYVVERLPEANKLSHNAPEIADVLALVREKLNPKRIDSLVFGTFGQLVSNHSQDWEDEEINYETDVSESENKKKVSFDKKTTTIPAESSSRSSHSEIDTLTEQLSKLSMSQAELIKLITEQQTRPQIDRPMRCMMCGVTNPTHAMHPRHCPETATLLAERLITHNPNTNRYTLTDGSDLPNVGNREGYGIAAFLRETNQQPRVARTQAVELIYNGVPVIQGDVFAVSSGIQDSYAVTRSGKDSDVRYNLIARPDKGKTPVRGSGQPAAGPSKTPEQCQAPIPNTSLAPTQVPFKDPPPHMSDAPQPPKINTRDGYRDATKKTPNLTARSRDVEMKDDFKKGPAYRFTSDIQEGVSLDSIMTNHVLSQTITIPLRNLLGASAGLQKKFADITKTRREPYIAANGEYDLYSAKAAAAFDLDFSNGPIRVQPVDTVYNDQTEQLSAFLLRHLSAASFIPTKLFAMATGNLTATINGTEVKAMIDCGSELNLLSPQVPEDAGLALDHRGSCWALKGVNGGPVQLRGCCQDAPFKIGSTNLPHHFFVSRESLGQNDVILGQPWIQWYSCRIDYDRRLGMSMAIWATGDRRDEVSLTVKLVKADHSRNVDDMGPPSHRITHEPHAHITTIEDADEQDF
ncbi:hypothetical protein C8J56DRAFT_793452 [Mycena floridula]|nr:hypothetical protein C8J56DRAFT_793452 [Mycena floridula]